MVIDARNPGTETSMVDVGGFRLCLSCSGEGEPQVVLISGSGAIAATWELVHSGSVVRKFGSLGNLPLAVLRRGKDDPTMVLPTMTPLQAEEAWRIAENNLAALSSNSVLLVAPNSRHNIMFDEPERVTEAVRIVVEAVLRNRRVEDIAALA
jgi:hypothetical protein